MKVEASIPALTMSPQEGLPSKNLGDVNDTPRSVPPDNPFINFLHRHTFTVVAVAVLVIGSTTIKLGANYWTAKNVTLSDNTAKVVTGTKPVSGFNLTIPANEFQAKLKSITSQPVTLKVGSDSQQINSDFVKRWLQISASKDKSEYYIHLNQTAMANSLVKEAGTYGRSPVNQVTVSEDGAKRVVVAGQNGRALADPGSLQGQAKLSAKNVLAGKGLQFNTPLKTTPFHAVTPANFDKLIVSDITTKKMWAFQNGKQVNNWLVSAGKPTTPTPLGQFKIYAKFTVQDMRGNNLDGSTYFQPHVRWISYFHEGSAIHGVYWHPLSWFGNINSSHGCIGVPDNQAKWIFDWAPVGTTVIVHA
jgi:hypothetical protein